MLRYLLDIPPYTSARLQLLPTSTTKATTMTSASEQQEPHPPHCTCGSLGADGSNNVDAETPASAQQVDEHDDLVGQTAKLDLEDQDPEPDITSKSNIDTWSDEDAPPKAMDENADPGLATATTAGPMSVAKVDQSKATENVKDAANGTVPKTAHAGSEQGDETDTPRFSTYVKLHNEVSITYCWPLVRWLSLTPIR